MAVITISREYGCAGEYVAERISKKLGYRYVNKEIIEYIAILTGVPKEVVEKYDEEMHSNFKAFISKYLDLDIFSDLFAKVEEAEHESWENSESNLFEEKFTVDHVMDSEIFQNMVERVIKKLADEDNVIILGRGSQCILRNYKNAYHFRLYADFEDRAKWVANREQISIMDAKEKIKEIDKRKKNFISHYYDEDIDNRMLYHLLINMSKNSIDKVVSLIINYIKDE
ncbi:cytidylate kinase-like family protein [Deferribacter thermophilus]|uniref:cytidylate kinase-like family protein n=1 Tax=Deferribacter thermophilus TaxID=53573 RepID=UPI003C239B63